MNIKKHDSAHVGVMSEKYLDVKMSSSYFQRAVNCNQLRASHVRVRVPWASSVTMQSVLHFGQDVYV